MPREQRPFCFLQLAYARFQQKNISLPVDNEASIQNGFLTS